MTTSKFWSIPPFSSHRGKTNVPAQQEATDVWVEAKLTASAFPDPLEEG